MNVANIVNARMVVSFIEQEETFRVVSGRSCYYKDHIGALLTDCVLQAGLNYNSVVAPRVNRLVQKFPEFKTVSAFQKLIENYGLEHLISWNHKVKLDRIRKVIDFCFFNEIETASDLLRFLTAEGNRAKFLEINGIGEKTYDYLLILLEVDAVAVDRHIFNFLSEIGIPSQNYNSVKTVVEYAADLMEIPRRVMDYSIWNFMVQDKKAIQYELRLT